MIVVRSDGKNDVYTLNEFYFTILKKNLKLMEKKINQIKNFAILFNICIYTIIKCEVQ